MASRHLRIRRGGATAPDVPAVTRSCGFTFTTTGRPCRNHVAEGVPRCRAGHPCAPPSAPDAVLAEAFDRLGVHPLAAWFGPTGALPSDPAGWGRCRRSVRAAELVRQALASDDAERLGRCAAYVLGDAGTALTLLGDPASRPARQAVVQHFGYVGALLVLGYEERWERVHLSGDGTGAGDADPGGDALPGRARRHDGTVDEVDPVGRHLDRLVRVFPRLDARSLYELLGKIERDEDLHRDEPCADAHRWLHATYAVAARDETAVAHQAYMRALDAVLRHVRTPVAS